MRKKIDERIRKLIESSISQRFRSLFVIIGDRGRDQIVNLYYMLTKMEAGKKPSVLWCYKKHLGFSSHRKKRMKQIKKRIRNGTYETKIENPFELFVSSANIRYCYYKETHNILGQTYQMCILQDFEALTPNLLCRTMETVEGGGIICILLKTMSCLKEFYTTVMDIHARYHASGSPSEAVIQPRFNKRFVLSLSECRNCLIMDDELNILPISRHAYSLSKQQPSSEKMQQMPIQMNQVSCSNTLEHIEDDLNKKNSIFEYLGNLAVTSDQLNIIKNCGDIIKTDAKNTIVALLAARGRGKSAALGILLAGAVACGYSNIFVTAPSPENLKTLYEMTVKSLILLGYKEHVHFDLVEASPVAASSLESKKKKDCLVRVNIYKNQKQYIQYVTPENYTLAAQQAELLVIDEAAAIPLNIVQKFFGSYPTFLSSTVQGYEGTGRSLTLKLLKNMQQAKAGTLGTHRILKTFTLAEPIRYNFNDPIEAWLNQLLCLDATESASLNQNTLLPPPNQCHLYLVNRDALFSYHTIAEVFLHKILSLFVSSHYKNSPDDLMILSDAPNQFLFVLLPPMQSVEQLLSDQNPTTASMVPDILCAVQVTLEGSTDRNVLKDMSSKGLRPSGNLISWLLSQTYIQEEDFGQLNGARIVRIAVHPKLQRLRYGTQALLQLEKVLPVYYKKMRNTKQSEVLKDTEQHINIKTDTIGRPILLPPLLIECSSLYSTENCSLASANDQVNFNAKSSALNPCLHYIGTCFGLTLNLFQFHNNLQYRPVYISQTKNEITGEHSAILIKALDTADVLNPNWVHMLYLDFRNRFIRLLPSFYRDFSIELASAVVTCNSKTNEYQYENKDGSDQVKHTYLPVLDSVSVTQHLDINDYLRLEKYTEQLVEQSLIMDLFPTLAELILNDRLPDTKITLLQKTVLLALGCQYYSISEITTQLELTESQTKALLNKTIYKIQKALAVLFEPKKTTAISNYAIGVDNFEAVGLPSEESLLEELEKNKPDSKHFSNPYANKNLTVKSRMTRSNGNDIKIKHKRLKTSNSN